MKKVLIIEDEVTLQQIYDELLQKEGVATLRATTGSEAMQLAIREIPDLILLDIMLPGGQNGFDVLEQLKRDERLRNIPVVVLTNLDSEEKTAREIGAVDYIIKANTSVESVIAKVKSHLGAHPS